MTAFGQPGPRYAAAELFAMTQDMTANAGLPAYETSNHARPGEESRHNLTYLLYGGVIFAVLGLLPMVSARCRGDETRCFGRRRSRSCVLPALDTTAVRAAYF